MWVPDTQPWTLTWGDSRWIAFGTIDGRDLATRVPDLLPTLVLDSPSRPLGHRQGRGDPGAARPGGRLAIANLVLRAPLDEEQNTRLREDWRVGRVAALMPLSSYPDLIAEGGLVLEEILDVSEDSIAQTFAAIEKSHTAQGMPEDTELAERLNDGAGRLADTPEFGFAIITAVKP
jgi:hypothetical protein